MLQFSGNLASEIVVFRMYASVVERVRLGVGCVVFDVEETCTVLPYARSQHRKFMTLRVADELIAGVHDATVGIDAFDQNTLTW